MEFSTAAVDCSGICNKSLEVGTEGHYIYDSRNPDRQPRFYCKNCFKNLSKKRTITATNTVTNEMNPVHSSKFCILILFLLNLDYTLDHPGRHVSSDQVHTIAKAANKRSML